MRTQLVYDLPTRIFHWIFAALFIIAFMVAKTIDDESSIFAYHMFAGLVLGFIVFLRLVWGIFGSKYVKFTNFALHPTDLVSYLTGIFSRNKKRWTGHNPASSWAALFMFAFAIGLAATGYLMTTGSKEEFEDLHEIFANLFLITVLAHIAGVILHSFRHKDNIELSMIDGHKTAGAERDLSVKNHSTVALIFVVMIALFTMFLFKNFDQQKQTLNFFGTTLQMGDHESHESSNPQQNEEEDDDDNEKYEDGD